MSQSHTTSRLLRLPAVESLVGLKRARLYNLIAEGAFPKQVHLGDAPNSPVAWPEHEIQAWINRRIAMRDQATEEF
nr:AlpA family transcriptional regulator [Methylobacterium sp. OTU13CASTA1]